MKRLDGIWEDLTSFENLHRAVRQAQRGKRFKGGVLCLSPQPRKRTLPSPGRTARPNLPSWSIPFISHYRSQAVPDSASPYRDRVVHHAVCNLITGRFERSFVIESNANRVRFGTHRAFQRFRRFTLNSRFLLTCEIRKYFPSIDHEILKTLLRKKIADAPTLSLLDLIIDSANEQENAAWYFPGDDLFTPHERRRGFPIGNLTSQFFANVFLDPLDHFIKQGLRVRRYVLYVDDFAVFDDGRDLLVEARHAIESYLVRLRLAIHPVKSQITETRDGANFVGFRIFPTHTRVRATNLSRSRRRIRAMRNGYRAGRVPVERVIRSLRSWNEHLSQADTWRLRENVFEGLVFQTASERVGADTDRAAVPGTTKPTIAARRIATTTHPTTATTTSASGWCVFRGHPLA